MKTIKINDNSIDDDFKDTNLVRLKDVLELIDEILNSQVKHIPRFELEELKSRINGDTVKDNEKGCGKKIQLKHYHLYCGDSGMYKLRLCPNCRKKLKELK